MRSSLLGETGLRLASVAGRVAGLEGKGPSPRVTGAFGGIVVVDQGVATPWSVQAYVFLVALSPVRRCKTEAIATTVFHDGPFKTLADVEYAAAGWVDWYNHRRLHSSLAMMTPTESEQAQYATLDREPQTI